jgi:hypothetical protein
MSVVLYCGCSVCWRFGAAAAAPRLLYSVARYLLICFWRLGHGRISQCVVEGVWCAPYLLFYLAPV